MRAIHEYFLKGEAILPGDAAFYRKASEMSDAL